MKKILLLCGIFICTAQQNFAQGGTPETDIVWGPEDKESFQINVEKIIGSDESGVYVLKKKIPGNKRVSFSILGAKTPIDKKASYIIEHYDAKMARTKFEQIPLEYENKPTRYEDILLVDGKLYLFSSYADKKLKKRFLFVQSINVKNLKPASKFRKISEIEIRDGKKQGYKAGSFDVAISEDESKVMIFYAPPMNNKEAKQRLGFHIFDSEMGELWNKSITLPYKDDLFLVRGYQVSNAGSAYLLGKNYEESRRIIKGKEPKFKFHVLAYSDNGKHTEEYVIKSEGHFFTDMKMKITPNEDILCGGFYNDVGWGTGMKGSYFMRVDGKSKEITSKNFDEFDSNFITEHINDLEDNKTFKSKGKEEGEEKMMLYRYRIDDIIMRSDGGAILVAEQYYITSFNLITTRNYTQNHNPPDVNSIPNPVAYHHNAIIMINIAPNGEIIWNQTIRKRQADSERFKFSSYSLVEVDDKLYFIFNDHIDNLNYKGKGEIKEIAAFKPEKNIASLVEVNASGGVNRQKLFGIKDVGFMMKPTLSKQTSEKELIIFAERGTKDRFAKVIFK